MDVWTIKAYKMVDGKQSLDMWASGLSHRHADSYFKSLRNSNEYSTVEMKKSCN